MALVIFHHIPKTAGTSLRHTVLQNYAPERVFAPEQLPEGLRGFWPKWWWSLQPAERARLECVLGGHHGNFLVPSLLYAGVPFRLLTMLRDPVERCASYYYFCRERAAVETGGMGRVGRVILESGLSLADIYRQIGDGNPNTSERHGILQGFFDGQARAILQPLTASQFAFRPAADDRVFLQTAREILERHYTVGVAEEYDKSLALYAETFGWTQQESVRLNVTSSRKDAPPLPAETIELIRAHNPLDLALHAEALARFR